jgi:hypothetical protein
MIGELDWVTPAAQPPPADLDRDGTPGLPAAGHVDQAGPDLWVAYGNDGRIIMTSDSPAVAEAARVVWASRRDER